QGSIELPRQDYGGVSGTTACCACAASSTAASGGTGTCSHCRCSCDTDSELPADSRNTCWLARKPGCRGTDVNSSEGCRRNRTRGPGHRKKHTGSGRIDGNRTYGFHTG